MQYSGKIDEIKQIIVSDPSYSKDVWCRYENDNLNAKDWNIKIQVSEYNETFDDMNVKGLDLFILMFHPNIHCDFTDKGFSHPATIKINEYTIGMDTACVSLGINDVADKIRSEIDEWKPVTCLKTLTDGEFGSVYEGKVPNSDQASLIVITGFLDEDTGYSEEYLIDYFKENFEVQNLSPIISNDEGMTFGSM